MPTWLTDLMGIELPPIPENGRRYLEFAGLPQGERLLFLLLFAAALVGVTTWLYRREGQAPTWQKAGLAALRILVIVVGFVVFAEPRLAVEIEKTYESVTLVLLDDSLSMSLKDRLDRPELKVELEAATGIKEYDLQAHSRAELVSAILANPKFQILPRLAENNELRLFTFGQRLEAIELAEGEAVSIQPRGQVTDLSGAIRAALEEVPGKTIAGVVVFTDGRANAGEHPSSVTGILRERKIPLFLVGIGNPDPPRNFEVVELASNPRVYKNDPMMFRGRMRATGYDGEQVEVVLERLDRSSNTTEQVASKTLDIKGKRFDGRMDFELTPDKPGEFLYTLKIEPREDELTGDDNAVSRPLSVIDDDTRALVIAGAPTWEFQRLRNLLMRERTVQVSSWLQTADADFPQDGNIRIESLPRTQEELFAYDVIILIDPKEDELDRGWLDLLKSFVGDHGGGLCYIAGDKHTSALLRNPDFLPLQQVLPIIPDIERAETLALTGRRFTEAWPVKLTPEGEDHSVTRLTGNTELTKRVWSKLPGTYWFFPVKREKPGATVLLRSTDPTRVTSEGAGILLAAHFYGPGRTVFQSFDTSWRWRERTRIAYQRYWVQLLRYLVEGRLLGGQRRMNLVTDKDSYELGDRMTLRVRVLDRSFQPQTGARLNAIAKLPDGLESEVRFTEDEARPGTYLAEFVPDKPGLYELSVEAPGLIGSEGGSRISKTLRVSLPNLEFSETALDGALLDQLGQATGGRRVKLPELGELPTWIPKKTETLRVNGTPIPLWDNRLTLIVVLLLLSLEWWFRKRARMV